MTVRIALLSDVHGHAVALRAVLAAIDAEGIDQIVVAGDIVLWGPHNDEVVDLLRARGARMIRGNLEAELVATYETPLEPRDLATDPRGALIRFAMRQLGPERGA